MVRAHQSYKEIAAQHGELQAQIRELRRYLEKDRPEPQDEEARRWASDLTGRLVSFQNILYHHFRTEELSGILEDVSQRFPRAQTAITTLMADHTRILQELNSILGAAMVYAQGQLPDQPNLRRWTHSLLGRLSHHEEEETELLQRLIYEELGQGD